jgi:hypothetical protein
MRITHTHDWARKQIVQEPLHGVSFSKINNLRLDVWIYCCLEEGKIKVPDVDMPCLETLEIFKIAEGEVVLSKLDVAQWDDLVLQIPVQ